MNQDYLNVQAFVRAWYKALDFAKQHPDEANEIMAKGVGGWLNDPKVFAETLSGIEYLDKDKNLAFFGTKEAPGQITKTLGTALDVWRSFGRIQVDVKPEDMIDYGYVGG